MGKKMNIMDIHLEFDRNYYSDDYDCYDEDEFDDNDDDADDFCE